MAVHFRLAELLAPLSYVTDLGMGEPEGQALRSTLLCVRFGELLGLRGDELADCYYTTMLRHIGCTATAHEESSFLVPDEISGRKQIRNADFTKPREALNAARGLLGEVPMMAWPRLLTHMAANPAWGRNVDRSLCEVAALAARRLGLGKGVEEGLYSARERWDGNGQPRGLRGEAITLPARLALACGQLASLSSAIGARDACAALHMRADGWLDPRIAKPLSEHGMALLEEIDAVDLLEAVLAAEPGRGRVVTAEEIDTVARTFADLTDLKTPWTHGHSAAVAEIAERAAATLKLSEADQATVRRAGLLHDIGRVGVPNSVWEKAGPLNSIEWEKVRLHPYHSERILSRCPALAPIARIAGMHHERQDGSGFHRQARGSAIQPAAWILAAADVYQAMTQERPYRPAWTVDRAAAELRRMSENGQLDPDAVAAVLATTGQKHKRAWPAGLSDREVEVLRLVAKGLSNRAIGSEMGISPRTAEHHVQSLYAKAGFSTRAAAALYAMENNLL
jgi:putative nucleotidyltransferase with HDIG domain